jgi:hypothetical protein
MRRPYRAAVGLSHQLTIVKTLPYCSERLPLFLLRQSATTSTAKPACASAGKPVWCTRLLSAHVFPMSACGTKQTSPHSPQRMSSPEKELSASPQMNAKQGQSAIV